MNICNIATDWSLSFSDHAAIIIELNNVEGGSTNRLRIARLDPTILNVDNVGDGIFRELAEKIDEAPSSWDLHMLLEYVKMCI